MENLEYKQLVLELVNEFKMSLSGNEETLVKKFEEYLYILIDKWKNETSKFLMRSKEEIESDLRSVTKRFASYSREEKEMILIEDEKFRQLASSSSYIYEIAKAVFNNQSVPIDYDDLNARLEDMIRLSEEVKDYNKKRSEQLISESILDVNFIKKPNTDILSLRLADEKRMQEVSGKRSKEEGEER